MSDIPIVFNDGSHCVQNFYYEPCGACTGRWPLQSCTACRGSRVYQFRESNPATSPVCSIIVGNARHSFLFLPLRITNPPLNNQIQALESFIKRQTKYRYDKQAFDAAVTRAMLHGEDTA